MPATEAGGLCLSVARGDGGVWVLATLGPGVGPGSLGCGRLRPVTAAFGFGSGTSEVLNDRFGSLRGLLSSEHLRNWANFQKFRADVAALAPGIARQAPTLSASAAGGRSPCSHPGTRQESDARERLGTVEFPNLETLGVK